MSILDKAKQISDRIVEKTEEFSSDDVIADTIIKAVAKQESVNKLLAERGSDYRVSDIDLTMGIPPSVTFGIRRLIGSQDEGSS